MFEVGGDRGLASRGFDAEVAAQFAAGGEVTGNQGDLGLLKGFGFGYALLEQTVEDVHQCLGATVIDGPQGRNGSFGSAALKLVANAQDFYTILIFAS